MPRGKQLSPKTRGKIEALHSTGHSVRQIAQFVQRSRNSVHQCLQRISRGSSDYKKRPGRGKATTPRDGRLLKRMALHNRRAPSRLLSHQLADEVGKQVSGRTVRRRLSETGLNARRPRKKPQLTEHHRRLRLGWAVTHRGWTSDDWKNVLFSDKSKVSLGSDGALYVWRRRGEEFLPECCDRTVQHAASVMVWGSMCWHGVGSLVKLEGRLNSTAYQRVLEEHMIADAEAMIGEDFVFQQDNAPIHTSRSTRQWLREHDVTLLEWPPKSPDANPIENLWRDMKTAANRFQPTTSDELWDALQEAWQQIPLAHIRNLVESVPRRLDAIRTAKGGNTRY